MSELASSHMDTKVNPVGLLNAKVGLVASFLAASILVLMVVLPVFETLARPLLVQGIPGSINYVRHGTLWVGFLGAVLAALEGRHLSLGTSTLLGGQFRRLADSTTKTLSLVTCIVLSVAAFQMVSAESQSSVTLGGLVPVWVAEIVMPLGFALMALAYMGQLIDSKAGITGLCVATIGFILFSVVDISRETVLIPGLIIIAIAALSGAPIFVVLGSLAIVFFFSVDVPMAAISVEAYRIASNPILPTIPLFTLAGTVMTAGNASARLVRLFQGLFGWMPGGTAIATICVCAFFTTFTGGSGVTILAMGSLMLPVLLRQGYRERFCLGVLTSSGSLGILLPPSLLIILYGVASQTPIDRLFIAGIIPGLLLVLAVCGYAVYKARQNTVTVNRFDALEALHALKDSKWDIFMPVAMLYGIFSGKATLVEVASLAAAYTLFVEFVIFRDLKLSRDLWKILKDCTIMVGGITIIIASAMGLTSYLIFQDVPGMASEWIQSITSSPWVFLLALNVFLLLAGCLLDIFSAIVVIVPLILPVAIAFGIDPVHLGILFLVNMELGYLTPPVGLNLYLASFRFKQPLMKVFVASLPFFLINLLVVLAVTFIPEITVGFANWVETQTGGIHE